MNEALYRKLQEDVKVYVNGPARALSERIEETGECGAEVREELKERGFLKLAAPEEYGGMGLNFLQYLELLELFSQLHGSIRMIVHVSNGIWRPIHYKASKEQKRRFVKPLVQGELTAAFALTEPTTGAGTDIRTSARKENGEFVLNGAKWMVAFGDTADYVLLFARMENSSGQEGTIALMVPSGSPGLSIKKMPPTLGLTGTGHAHLYFKDCRVPEDCLIGEVGQGLSVAMNGFLNPSRISVGMTCVGLAQRALDLSVERSRKRVTYGKPLSQRPIVQTWLAEMATDIEAARQLCLHAGRAQVEGELTPAHASMAKLFALEMLQRVTDKAQQIYGGISYFKGMEIERIYRDARAQKFEEGTSEIQKAVIARQLLAKD
ncbi:acyl-CoA dehydrogenase family protein [Cohnella thailandensis]|uniref:Acyl-CoA dehydrogenase family protein n=1 Tax=Cohnella thailandensis TaxID=557557 RepID=A0A841ST50_9BACL|nr:acyl-CoA dehydrogenase family protein [Cohnella thailandensis]MBB6634402.1 acyl-CoA dehydrogenase family protein [Cohnella thailandensis]MBP1972098.1 acyl-CoA dehydrogenase [Cohnella thailandensis]